MCGTLAVRPGKTTPRPHPPGHKPYSMVAQCEACRLEADRR